MKKAHGDGEMGTSGPSNLFTFQCETSGERTILLFSSLHDLLVLNPL